MESSEAVKKPHISTGDLAVDGIITGIEAGLLMAAFLLGTAAWQGNSPVAVISAFSLRGSPALVTGILTHLAVSSVYGIFFTFGYFLLSRLGFGSTNPFIGPLCGLTYGTLLFVAAEYFFFDHAATDLKNAPLFLMLVAHLVYGFSLGILVARRSRTALK